MRFLFRSFALFGAVAYLSSITTGCASFAPAPERLRPLRISDVMEAGDAARRASLRLVEDGLEADAAGAGARAQSRYQRALQVDVTNPYAYLAIARHHLEAHDTDRALQFLDRADSLLRMEDALGDEVKIHLDGLRGGALYDSGQAEEGAALLDRVRTLAPEIWGDGALQPDELR